jgi:ABC-type Fe3+ transport system permease subunit
MKRLVPVLLLLGFFASGVVFTVVRSADPAAWAALASPALVSTLGFTAWYSAAAGLGAAVFGTALALALPARSATVTGSRWWLALPPVTVGFLTVLVLGPTGVLAAALAPLTGGVPLPSPVRASNGLGILIASWVKETAFVTLWVRGAASAVDPRLVATATMLGAGRWQTFREVWHRWSARRPWPPASSWCCTPWAPGSCPTCWARQTPKP